MKEDTFGMFGMFIGALCLFGLVAVHEVQSTKRACYHAAATNPNITCEVKK